MDKPESAPEDNTKPDPAGAPGDPMDDSPDEPFDQDRAMAKIRKANSEAANLRKRLQELEPLAAKAKELEDANKSELQKLQETVDEFKSRATTAEAKARKLSVALDAAPEGATIEQIRAVAKRVTGDSDEELKADAEELFGLLGSKSTTGLPGKPKERLRGGGDPSGEPEERDPSRLAALIPRDR